jgi:hypothetical protein
MAARSKFRLGGKLKLALLAILVLDLSLIYVRQQDQTRLERLARLAGTEPRLSRNPDNLTVGQRQWEAAMVAPPAIQPGYHRTNPPVLDEMWRCLPGIGRADWTMAAIAPAPEANLASALRRDAGIARCTAAFSLAADAMQRAPED